MAKIVAIHGIAQQLLGSESLAKDWRPALRDGMRNAGIAEVDLPSDDDIAVVFYGELFRKTGLKAAGQGADFEAADVRDGIEKDLLGAWWEAAMQQGEPSISKDGAKVWAPAFVQRALSDLCRTRFFSGVSERLMIGDLKQVSLYLENEALRKTVRDRLLSSIALDTRVVIGHSLGSVIAYEALCKLETPPVALFVTIGSPLGLRRPIFDKLDPLPKEGVGAWPPAVKNWTNIAAGGDLVAAVKQLGPLFKGYVGAVLHTIDDKIIDNETRAHDATAYLTARETGRAIAVGLAT